MNRLKIVTVCGAALLIVAAVAVVVASRNRQQPAPPPDAPVAALPAEVRVKAVERKPEPMDHYTEGSDPFAQCERIVACILSIAFYTSGKFCNRVKRVRPFYISSTVYA